MARRRIDIDIALPGDASAAAVARREIRTTLPGTLPQCVLDDLSLVVCELVTNAVVHGQGAVRLRLQVDSEGVQGEVIDGGCGFEHVVGEVGPSASSGRGLLIVDRLATRWGVHEGSTRVWFEMFRGRAQGSMTLPGSGREDGGAWE
jgi:anti-sigma regulatory factor (Ser/Thr protein kinase)